MAPSEIQKNSTLKAEYASQSSSKTFSHDLPKSPDPKNTEEKTAYLSTLRTSVIKLQDEVNSFLTQKMEEDKSAAAASKGKVDEQREEENYGEEIVEDED
ncbi:MAG: hypothetical protein M1827_005100 [Pycnora praestabilis]|nr:MAG: hypothetical protein M1827_005100 [Pycnora praestabilis]